MSLITSENIQSYVDSLDQTALLELATLLNNERVFGPTEVGQQALFQHAVKAIAANRDDLDNEDERLTDGQPGNVGGSIAEGKPVEPVVSQYLVQLSDGEYVVVDSYVTDLNLLLTSIPEAVSVVNLSVAGSDLVETAIGNGAGVELGEFVEPEPEPRTVHLTLYPYTINQRNAETEVRSVQELINALTDIIDVNGITDINDIEIDLD